MTFDVSRRTALVGGASVMASTLPFGCASAADVYPSRPVHVSIGFPAGSGADILCRYFAHALEEKAKQPFILENRPGATGNIALRFIARSEPDGYNLLMTANSNMAGSRYLFKDLSFDTLTDFKPVASYAQIAFVVVVAPDSPINTIAELVARMKAKPNNLHGYTNQTAQLSSELFKQLAGVEAKAVSYKAASDAMKDILDGTLDFMILDGTFAAGQARQGQLKALAVTTTTRSPSFPGVPTLVETGLKEFDFSPWWALYAPVKTPQAIVDQLAGWLHEINKLPATAAFLETVGSIVNDDTGPQADARLKAELPKWERLVKLAGIEPQ
jgi:tripartite-type tricarboxylate transporter receptor subunit TctC